MANFSYLVRFKDDQGVIHYGEAGSDALQSELVGKTVDTYSGGLPWDVNFKLTGRSAKIVEVLHSTNV